VKLERAWAAKQAKQRELGDVTDMLELGEEFAVVGAAEELEKEEDGFHDSDSEEWSRPTAEGGSFVGAADSVAS
jgi:hypothetical protein